MHTQRMMGRLLAVDWGGNFDHVGSRVRLAHLYLARASLWATEMTLPVRRPFYDLAAVLGHDGLVTQDQRDAFEEVTDGGHTRRMVVAAVGLAAMRDHGVDLPALPDLYEPLVLAFERAGEFSSCGGYLDVDLGGILIRDLEHYADDETEADLGSAALDLLDAEFTARRASRMP